MFRCGLGRLHLADLHRLFQRLKRIASRGRRIFVGDVAAEAGVRDGLRHEMIIQFLRFVDLMTAGISAGMEVRNMLDVVANSSGDIAVNELHVIGVVEPVFAQRDQPGKRDGNLHIQHFRIWDRIGGDENRRKWKPFHVYL